MTVGRISVGLVLLVLMTGCASMASQRAHAPQTSYHTTKSPDQTKDCLVQAFSAAKFMGVAGIVPIATPYNGGYVLTFSSDPRLFVDVLPEGTGSRVNHHQSQPFMGMGAFKNALGSCRDG